MDQEEMRKENILYVKNSYPTICVIDGSGEIIWERIWKFEKDRHIESTLTLRDMNLIEAFTEEFPQGQNYIEKDLLEMTAEITCGNLFGAVFAGADAKIFEDVRITKDKLHVTFNKELFYSVDTWRDVAYAESKLKEEAERQVPSISIDREGYVYFICTQLGAKIGMSQKPRSRTKALGTKLPCEILWVYSYKVNDRRIAEQALHTEYATSRGIGEWFRLSTKQIHEAGEILKENFKGELSDGVGKMPEEVYENMELRLDKGLQLWYDREIG